MGRKKRSYIFTNKRHSEKAIMSSVLGIISTLSLSAVVYLTYAQKGEAPAGYGVTGLLVVIFSMAGLILGIVTVTEKDRYKFFPWLGIVTNLIALLGIGFVVYAGIYLS